MYKINHYRHHLSPIRSVCTTVRPHLEIFLVFDILLVLAIIVFRILRTIPNFNYMIHIMKAEIKKIEINNISKKYRSN